MRELDQEARDALPTVMDVYRLLEDSLTPPANNTRSDGGGESTSCLSSNVALSDPVEMRIENLKKETFAREMSASERITNDKDEEAIISSCLISNCSESTIYVLAPVEHVRIDKVIDCVIFIGCVSSAVFITRCERVNVVSASKYLFCKSSHDCTFNVALETNPIFVGDSRGCMVGPYNSYYGDLLSHLKRCHLRYDSRKMTESWKHARIISSNPDPDSGSESDSDQDGGRYSGARLQKPEDFGPFIVPFLPVENEERGDDDTNKEITRANVFRIPGEYVASLDEKNELVASFRKEMVEKMSSSLSNDAAVQLIQREFCEWLKVTGKSRHVSDLVKLEKEGGMGDEQS